MSKADSGASAKMKCQRRQYREMNIGWRKWRKLSKWRKRRKARKERKRSYQQRNSGS
jgi:hypothetical protein